CCVFFFQAEDGIRDDLVTGVQTCALPISLVADIFKSVINGLVRVVGDGNNRWPLVYDRDLADLYARLATNPDASGVYHANDEGDERVNEIVSAIAPYLPVPPDVRHVPIAEAGKKMGPVAEAMALDQVVR